MVSDASGRRDAFRWSRVATLVAVLLLHAGFAALFLLPAAAWQRRASTPSTMRPDALSVRFIALPPPRPATQPGRPAPPVRAKPPLRRTVVEVRALVPHPPDSTLPSPPLPAAGAAPATGPAYIAGGGRFAEPEYGRDNVHLPGSTQRVAGAPVLRMADPKMQGIAGTVRTVQRLFGIPEAQCVDVDTWRGMTTRERIAKHIDDARIEETAARYHCGP